MSCDLPPVLVPLQESPPPAQYGARSVAAYVGCGRYRNSAAGPWFCLQVPGGARLSELLHLLHNQLAQLFPLLVPTFRRPCAREYVGRIQGGYCHARRHESDRLRAAHHAPVQSPQTSARLRKRGMKLIVIDPRRVSIAKQADLHLQGKPGETLLCWQG